MTSTAPKKARSAAWPSLPFAWRLRWGGCIKAVEWHVIRAGVVIQGGDMRWCVMIMVLRLLESCRVWILR